MARRVIDVIVAARCRLSGLLCVRLRDMVAIGEKALIKPYIGIHPLSAPPLGIAQYLSPHMLGVGSSVLERDLRVLLYERDRGKHTLDEPRRNRGTGGNSM